MCLATMAYVYASCIVCVTIFSTGGKFHPVSNFTELHACSYALFVHVWAPPTFNRCSVLQDFERNHNIGCKVFSIHDWYNFVFLSLLKPTLFSYFIKLHLIPPHSQWGVLQRAEPESPTLSSQSKVWQHWEAGYCTRDRYPGNRGQTCDDSGHLHMWPVWGGVLPTC